MNDTDTSPDSLDSWLMGQVDRYPLMSALLGRRSRRFAPGMTIPSGPFRHWTTARMASAWDSITTTSGGRRDRRREVETEGDGPKVQAWAVLRKASGTGGAWHIFGQPPREPT